jgi:hypothetical protein
MGVLVFGGDLAVGLTRPWVNPTNHGSERKIA